VCVPPPVSESQASTLHFFSRAPVVVNSEGGGIPKIFERERRPLLGQRKESCQFIFALPGVEPGTCRSSKKKVARHLLPPHFTPAHIHLTASRRFYQRTTRRTRTRRATHRQPDRRGGKHKGHEERKQKKQRGKAKTIAMSRPQEVSLARLLHVYETKAAAGGAAVGVTGSGSGTAGSNRTRPPQRSGGGRNNGGATTSTSDSGPTSVGADDGGGGGGGGRGGGGGGGGGAASDGAGAGEVDGDGDGWRRGPKAHQHLEAMRTLLAEVRAHDADAADAYGKRVDRVEAMLVGLSRLPGCHSTPGGCRIAYVRALCWLPSATCVLGHTPY
jgi:hypothetical protein